MKSKSVNVDVYSAGENLQWITVILLSILSYYGDQSLQLLLIAWVVVILTVGNARRIYVENESGWIMGLRRLCYVVPFLFPLALGFRVNIVLTLNQIYWVLIGIASGIGFILPKLKTWQLILSYDWISVHRRQEKYNYWTMIMIYIGAAITEEIFFRNVIIQSTRNSLGIYSVFLGATLFVVYHLGCKWSSEGFSLYDYGIQFVAGMSSGLLFYYTESILPSILLHLTYNSPHILFSVKEYHYFYTKEVSKRSELGEYGD